MITITIDDKGVMVSGHARAGPEGQDIVCSAISVLVQTLEESLRELTGDNIKSNISPGMAFIEYKDLSEQGKLLVESFFIGVCGVATAAPENVKVIREVNTVGAFANAAGTKGETNEDER